MSDDRVCDMDDVLIYDEDLGNGMTAYEVHGRFRSHRLTVKHDGVPVAHAVSAELDNLMATWVGPTKGTVTGELR